MGRPQITANCSWKARIHYLALYPQKRRSRPPKPQMGPNVVQERFLEHAPDQGHTEAGQTWQVNWVKGRCPVKFGHSSGFPFRPRSSSGQSSRICGPYC